LKDIEDRKLKYEHHGKTKENTQGTDCFAHLHDGKVFKCPYSTQQEAQHKCSDYTTPALKREKE